VNGGLRIGELRLNVGGLVDPSWIGRQKAKRTETKTLREDGTPGPGEETDEVALRRRKRRKRRMDGKEAAKDADKGWWFGSCR